MKTTCVVCDLNFSKYKCPQCSIRYCSLACFKVHKNSHTPDEAKSKQTNESPASQGFVAPVIVRENHTRQPQTPEQIAAILETSPELQELLKTHPDLVNQLQRVHELATEPPENWTLNQSSFRQGHHPRRVNSAASGWKPQKGEALALKRLQRLRNNHDTDVGSTISDFLAIVEALRGEQLS